LKAFENMDIKNFYSKLSANDKKIVDRGDEFGTIELLKKSPEYKSLEEMKTLVTKCLWILNQTAMKEVHATEAVYADMKKAQNQTQESADTLNQLYTSAAVESQRFDKTSVIHHLDQYAEKLGQEVRMDTFGESLRGASDKATLDKTILDFIKKRAEYNKIQIMKNKLTGVQKLDM